MVHRAPRRLPSVLRASTIALCLASCDGAVEPQASSAPEAPPTPTAPSGSTSSGTTSGGETVAEGTPSGAGGNGDGGDPSGGGSAVGSGGGGRAACALEPIAEGTLVGSDGAELVIVRQEGEAFELARWSRSGGRNVVADVPGLWTAAHAREGRVAVAHVAPDLGPVVGIVEGGRAFRVLAGTGPFVADVLAVEGAVVWAEQGHFGGPDGFVEGSIRWIDDSLAAPVVRVESNGMDFERLEAIAGGVLATSRFGLGLLRGRGRFEHHGDGLHGVVVADGDGFLVDVRPFSGTTTFTLQRGREDSLELSDAASWGSEQGQVRGLAADPERLFVAYGIGALGAWGEGGLARVDRHRGATKPLFERLGVVPFQRMALIDGDLFFTLGAADRRVVAVAADCAP